VQLYDVPQKDWPVMAGDYKLFFPDTGSRMEFTINEARITAREGALPNIHPPDVEGTDVKVIQIGAGAGV
jgi:hypothetical protein